MNLVRYVLVLVGVAAFAVGMLAGLTSSSPAAPLVAEAIGLLGNDYLLVAVVAGVALVLTLIALAIRAVKGSTQFVPPDPEGIPSAPPPGHELDAYLDGGIGLRQWLFTDEGDRVRRRLYEAAIQTVMWRANCTREGARRRVDRGEWTDDPEAAAFLGDDSLSPPRLARIKAALGGERWAHRGARRTARAIVRLSGGERSNE